MNARIFNALKGYCGTTLLGFGLKHLRESKKWAQDAFAEAAGVSQSAVSKWESSGRLPESHWPRVFTTLDTNLQSLRSAAAKEMAGRVVRGREAVDLWRDAIVLSNLPSDVKLMLAVVPLFYDDAERFVQFRPEDIAGTIGLDFDEVAERWETFLESGFLEPIGPSGDLFELKFPEN